MSAALGAVLATGSAACFAASDFFARAGMRGGDPRQGIIVTVPMGVVVLLPLILLWHGAASLTQFSAASLGWLAAAGSLHFIIGRLANFSAIDAAGMGLAAPILQLQIIVTLGLAMLFLGETCSVLQALGVLAMLAGGFTVIRSRPPTQATSKPVRPIGFVYATIAALAFGCGPFMARLGLLPRGPGSGIPGLLIASVAATFVLSLLVLVLSPWRTSMTRLTRESFGPFVNSGFFVLASQVMYYSAISIAPLFVVAPLMNLTVVFRQIASGIGQSRVSVTRGAIAGSLLSFAGALMVSVPTEMIVGFLPVPSGMAALLRLQF